MKQSNSAAKVLYNVFEGTDDGQEALEILTKMFVVPIVDLKPSMDQYTDMDFNPTKLGFRGGQQDVIYRIKETIRLYKKNLNK